MKLVTLHIANEFWRLHETMDCHRASVTGNRSMTFFAPHNIQA
jgi:hypothetical protein